MKEMLMSVHLGMSQADYISSHDQKWLVDVQYIFLVYFFLLFCFSLINKWYIWVPKHSDFPGLPFVMNYHLKRSQFNNP